MELDKEDQLIIKNNNVKYKLFLVNQLNYQLIDDILNVIKKYIMKIRTIYFTAPTTLMLNNHDYIMTNEDDVKFKIISLNKLGNSYHYTVINDDGIELKITHSQTYILNYINLITVFSLSL